MTDASCDVMALRQRLAALEATRQGLDTHALFWSILARELLWQLVGIGVGCLLVGVGCLLVVFWML